MLIVSIDTCVLVKETISEYKHEERYHERVEVILFSIQLPICRPDSSQFSLSDNMSLLPYLLNEQQYGRNLILNFASVSVAVHTW